MLRHERREAAGNSNLGGLWSRRATNRIVFFGTFGQPIFTDNTGVHLIYGGNTSKASTCVEDYIPGIRRLLMEYNTPSLQIYLISVLHSSNELRDYRQGDIVLEAVSKMDMVLTSKLGRRPEARLAYGTQTHERESHLSISELCWKIPAPCVSPPETSSTILPPTSTTTLVGQSSTSTPYTSPAFTGRTSVDKYSL